MTVEDVSSTLRAFTDALLPIRRAWFQAANVAMDDLDLPSSMSAAILMVSRAGPDGIRQNDLAEEVGIHPTALVRVLDQAQKEDILARRESQTDRRVKTIHLLPRGEQLASRIELAITKLRATLLRDMAPADIEAATRVLRQFGAHTAAYLQEARAKR